MVAQRPLWTTYAMLLTVAVTWGAAWPVGRALALAAPPWSAMALRYCLAVPLLFVWLHFAEGVRVPPRSEWRALAVMGVTSVVLYQIGFIFGMRETAASDASLVIALNPVMVALLSVPLLGYRLTRNASIGLASGFAGVALIFLASPNEQIPLEQRLYGNGLIIFGAFAYSIYTVALRSYLLRGGSQSPLGALTWASLFGTLVLLPPMLVEQPWEHAWTMDEWAFLAYLGVLSTVVCYAFYAMGIADIGAPRAASFINLVPIFGIATAVMWPSLDEQFGLTHIVSFALVYAGVRLVNTQPPEGVD